MQTNQKKRERNCIFFEMNLNQLKEKDGEGWKGEKKIKSESDWKMLQIYETPCLMVFNEIYLLQKSQMACYEYIEISRNIALT